MTDLTGRRGTLSVAFVTDTNVPWVVLHDTTDDTTRGDLPFTHEITYRVDQGRANRLVIPIVQPAGALGSRNAPVTPRVHVSVVREEPSIGEPQLPRFTWQGPDHWSTSIIAVPATIVLGSDARPDVTPCPDGIRMDGENGGFVRLVALFVGTIVLWIPLYFWWAGRRRPGEEEAR